jgi:hypothetical protein
MRGARWPMAAGLLCVSCTEKALTDDELDVGLRNARVGIATECLKLEARGTAEVTVSVSIDIDPRGEPRYVRATSAALTPKATTCIQDSLMRLRFRPGGTSGPRARTMIVNMKDDLPPSLTW